MLTSWRDQADLIIRRCWDSPVLTIIARLILGKISIVPDQSSHGAYIFDQAVKSCSSNMVPSSFRLGYPRERSAGSSSGIHAFARSTRLWPRLLRTPSLDLGPVEVVKQAVSARLAGGEEHHLIKLQRPKHVVTRCRAVPQEYKPPSA